MSNINKDDAMNMAMFLHGREYNKIDGNPSTFQKLIDDKFYLTFEFYIYPVIYNLPFDLSVNAQVQFKSNDKTFNVELFDCVDVVATEDFFKNMFTAINCEPYQ